MTAEEVVEVSAQEAQILEAARDLILEGGLEALSMRAVAERVGVSATALYHYFANKQDLVDKVTRGAFEHFDATIRGAADRQPVGSIERVRAIGEAYVQFARENEAYFRVIFDSTAPDPRTLEDLPGGGGYPVLRQAVTDAMESGQMRRLDADVVSVYLWALVHGIVTLYLACKIGDEECEGGHLPADPQQLFGSFRDLIRHGLAAPGVA